MALGTMDDLVAALGRTTGTNKKQVLGFNIPSQASKGATTYHSMWSAAGFPGASSTPATGNGAVPTNATGAANSRFKWTNPTSASTYLAQINLVSSQTSGFMLYDRLWHNSGLSAITTTAQTLTSSTLTRPDANGVGAEIWFEVGSATGWTGTNFTPSVSYTASDGTAGRTATMPSLGATPVSGQMMPLTLQAGDVGVRSIQSVTVNASQAGGDFGLIIQRRLVEVAPWGAVLQIERELFDMGAPQLYDSAALAFVVICNTTTTGYLQGFMTLIQG